MPRRHLLLLLPLLLALPSLGIASGPKASGQEGGAPLPPGAVSRLGEATPVRIWVPVGAGAEDRPQLRQAEKLRGVQQVCVAADGKTVTTRKGDGTIQVWQLATGKLLHQWSLDGERAPQLSPDSKTVAAVDAENTLVLHEADTGKLLRRFRKPLPAELCSLTFSVDGKTLIAGHFDPLDFSLWDVADGQMLSSTKYDEQMILTAAVSPDGESLALGSMEGMLRIWDRKTRKHRCRRDGYGPLGDLAFSPAGSLLATVSNDRCVWLWDTKGYDPVRRLSWRGLQASFVVFSPDGKLLACNPGQHVVLWEVGTGKVWRTLSGHQGPVTAATFTLDGKQLLTGSRDGSVLVWDLTAPPPPAPPTAPVRRDRYGEPLPDAARARLGCLHLYSPVSFSSVRERLLAFSADGKQLFVGTRPLEERQLTDDEARQAALDLYPSDSSPGVRVLEVPTGKESFRLEQVPEGIDGLALSPDGKTLAALAGPVLYLWDAHTGKVKRMAHDNLPPPNVAPRPPRLLAFSPDGRLLAAADEEHIELLDASTGRRIRELAGTGPRILALAFSRTGKQLIALRGPSVQQGGRKPLAVDPGAVISWDAGTGKIVRRMTLPVDQDLGSFCLSADGALFGACQGLERTRLWDVAAGRELPSLPWAGFMLAFSPDGKQLAVGGPDLRLWDLASRKESLSLPSPEGFVWEVCFARDGKRLVTRGSTRLHFWDLVRGQEIVSHEGHRGAIHALACAARDNLLLSGGADHTLRLWDTAAGRVVRELVGHEEAVVALALSPDGTRAASLDVAGQAILWDFGTGRRLRQVKLAAPLRNAFSFNRGQTVAFCEDGKVLLVADGADRVRLWQLSPWRELRSFQGDPTPEWPAALSADGKLLALPGGSFEGGNRVRVLETDTGAERVRLEHKEKNGRFHARLFSPDGGYLAVGRVLDRRFGDVQAAEPDRIALYEVSTGKEVLALDSGGRTAVLAFSPDGKRLVAAGWPDKGPALWDVRTGKLLAEMSGHKDGVTALAFSADGRTLFSAGSDGTILVWDVDRLPQRQPPPHDLTAPQLQQAWDALAGTDAARAFRAIADLSSLPAKTLPFLQARLRPIVIEDPQRIARLIADLDSEDFAVREEATRRLREKADQAEPALRQALRKQPALETSRRLERILRHLQTSPEQQRAWRVCLLLDWMDTPEADKLLQTLAEGAADARLTREARTALERRARRQISCP